MARGDPNTTCASCSIPIYCSAQQRRLPTPRYCRSCWFEARRVPWEIRLAARIDKTPGHGPDGTCWVWTGSRQGDGYGTIRASDRTMLTHRAAWIVEHGPIPDGLKVLHRCDNPPCCNPAHLFLGTDQDNSNDMIAKGRSNKASGDAHGFRFHPERWRRGENHTSAKLTATQVLAIRAEYAQGSITCVRLGAKYGINHASTYAIVKRKTWKHI